jgi:hypothetical protein
VLEKLACNFGLLIFCEIVMIFCLDICLGVQHVCSPHLAVSVEAFVHVSIFLSITRSKPASEASLIELATFRSVEVGPLFDPYLYPNLHTWGCLGRAKIDMGELSKAGGSLLVPRKQGTSKDQTRMSSLCFCV